jgi:hypothetical protein
MSGLFGAPFNLLQSPNLPVRSSKSRRKQPAENQAPSSSSKHDVANAAITADQMSTTLASSAGSRAPQPQPQDLDGTTLAPPASNCTVLQRVNSATSAHPSDNSVDAAPAICTSAVVPDPVVQAAATILGNDLCISEDCLQQNHGILVSPLHSDAPSESESRNYSPVMDQLDETMVLLKSMQVAARAANGIQTPRPIPLNAQEGKSIMSSPSISLSAHSAQREAWLSGYSSGLAHAHAQALYHVEELGNVQTQLAAHKDATDDLRSKVETFASQLSFLQGTCTQAFTGIWKAMGRNTSMIEERLQVETALQARIDSLDARVLAHSIELQHQSQSIAAMCAPKLSQCRSVLLRLSHMPAHLVFQCLVVAVAVELLLRNASLLLGSRFRFSRKLMRRISALIAVVSFLRLATRASHVAYPAVRSVCSIVHSILHPVAVLHAAADRGDVFFLRSFLDDSHADFFSHGRVR